MQGISKQCRCAMLVKGYLQACICFALQGAIYLTIQYKPISEDPLWNSGVLGSSRGKEDKVPDGAVPHVYFPLRKGCKVTMYNDAHQVCTLAFMSKPSGHHAS